MEHLSPAMMLAASSLPLPSSVRVRVGRDGRVEARLRPSGSKDPAQRDGAPGSARKRFSVEWPEWANDLELEIRLQPPPSQLRGRGLDVPSLGQAVDSEFPGVARLNHQFRFTEVSPEYATILGYEPTALTNLLSDANVHPEDATLVQEAHDRLLSIGVVEYESRAYRADHSVFWQRVMMVEERDLKGRLLGYYRFLADVTLTRAATGTLRSREQRLRVFLEAVPDPMVRLSRDGICVDCLLPADGSVGLPPGWFLGRNIRELGLPDEVVTSALAVIEVTLFTGQLQTCEFDLQDDDGRRYFDCRVAPCGPDSVVVIAREITEQRQSSLKLAESERFITRLADSSPAVIYVFDLERAETFYINHEVTSLLGYSSDDVRSLGELPLESLVHPQDLQARQVAFKELCKGSGDDYVESEFRLRQTDGAWRWFSARETVFVRNKSGRAAQVLGVAIDVTERRDAEMARRESEERLRLLAAHASDIISLHDAQWRFLDVSPACKRILGYAPAALLNRSLQDIVLPQDWPNFLQYFSAVQEQAKGGGVEFRAWNSEGDEIWLEATAQPARASTEGAQAIVCVIRDVTERRRETEERDRLQQQVYQAQRLSSLGILSGGIAHDFNNLLQSIQGNADLGRQIDGLPEEAVRYFETISIVVKRATDLTKQMLLHAGDQSYEFAPFQLNEGVKEMIRLMEVSVPRDVCVEFDLAPELPLVDGDAGQIRQVILNLLTNAAESITAESGSVLFRTRPCVLRPKDISSLQFVPDTMVPGPKALLEVRDNGCGMDSATLSRIFDPFFSTKFPGRGLGLATVLAIARSHSAAVAVTSEVGQGTTFRLYFPLSKAPAIRQLPPTPFRERWNGKGRRVLVVEDEPMVRTVLVKMMQRLDLQADLARDGVEGVEMFSLDPDKYEAVFLDLIMPRMSGGAALSAVKRIRPNCPVAILTGHGALSIEGATDEHKPNAFLHKPVDFERLVGVLRELFGEN